MLRRFFAWWLSRGPKLDITLGNSLAGRIRDALVIGDWRRISAVFDTVADAYMRDFLVGVATSVEGRPGWIDEWRAERPNEANARTVSAANAISWAWEARGSGRGSTVTEERGRLFFSRLEQAEDDLLAAQHLIPDDPTPRTYSILSAMGLGLGIVALRERFGQCMRCSPGFLPAYHRMLVAIAERWGGEPDDGLTLARQAMLNDPSGRMAGVLADAHLQRIWDISMDSAAEGQAYIRRPDVIREIRGAAHAASSWPDDFHLLHGRNIIACACMIVNDPVNASIQFDAIRNRATEYPWNMNGDALHEFQKAQRLVRNVVG